MTDGEAAAFARGTAPLAVATRSGMRESLHHGAGVAVDGHGVVVAALGDPDLVVYPRSCLKPLQADALVAAGLELPDDLLAVACASHDGGAEHLAAVRSILELHGLDEHDLRNTPARPYGAEARSVARLAGTPPSSLQQNCSGKHAAMLATCRVNGWPTEGYIDPDHPVQRVVTGHLATLGCRVGHIGVDGCGAPTHTLGLTELAGAYSRLAASEARVVVAMRTHPTLVGGSTRDVTRWMQAVPGLVAKEGAAGVMAAVLPDGRAVAYKVGDGSDVARRAVVPAALRAAGVDVATLAPELAAERVPVLGHGVAVGAVEPLEWPPWSS